MAYSIKREDNTDRNGKPFAIFWVVNDDSGAKPFRFLSLRNDYEGARREALAYVHALDAYAQEHGSFYETDLQASLEALASEPEISKRMAMNQPSLDSYFTQGQA
jgi:hypothetical protein